jgi:hypothetical protein
VTRKEFVALEKALLPELPGFAIKGSLMLMPPVQRLLRGVSFEGSSFDKTTFYATVFVMPLCVPTNYLYFLFGDRIRHKSGADGWNIRESNVIVELGAALKQRALPFLSRAKSLVDFVEVAKDFAGNPHTPKAIGFALAQAGHVDQAVDVLGQLLGQVDLNVGWQREIAAQAGALRAQLIADPAGAQQQLETWETETVHKLGLDAFRPHNPGNNK